MPNETNTAVVKTDEKPVEFVPFGAEDKISLTIRQVQNLIAVKTKTGKTCSNNDAIKFIMMCLARRLNPYEGDAFLIGYDNKDGTASFSLITAHQAFLKRAELNKEYDGMKSGIIVDRAGQVIDLEGDFYLEGDKVLGGWATVFFKDRKQPMHKRVRMERFRKPFGMWADASGAASQICKCSEADALRSSFPTMLGGLYLKEELEPEAADARVSKPIFSIPEATVQAATEGPTVGPATLLTDLRALCVKDGIHEEFLMAAIQQVGLVDEAIIKLEELDEKILQVVINSWDSLAAKIKEEEV